MEKSKRQKSLDAEGENAPDHFVKSNPNKLLNGPPGNLDVGGAACGALPFLSPGLHCKSHAIMIPEKQQAFSQVDTSSELRAGRLHVWTRRRFEDETQVILRADFRLPRVEAFARTFVKRCLP